MSSALKAREIRKAFGVWTVFEWSACPWAELSRILTHYGLKIKDRRKVKEVGTWWRLYSLLPVSPREGPAVFRKMISETLL